MTNLILKIVLCLSELFLWLLCMVSLNLLNEEREHKNRKRQKNICYTIIFISMLLYIILALLLDELIMSLIFVIVVYIIINFNSAFVLELKKYDIDISQDLFIYFIFLVVINYLFIDNNLLVLEILLFATFIKFWYINLIIKNYIDRNLDKSEVFKHKKMLYVVLISLTVAFLFILLIIDKQLVLVKCCFALLVILLVTFILNIFKRKIFKYYDIQFYIIAIFACIISLIVNIFVYFENIEQLELTEQNIKYPIYICNSIYGVEELPSSSRFIIFGESYVIEEDITVYFKSEHNEIMALDEIKKGEFPIDQYNGEDKIFLNAIPIKKINKNHMPYIEIIETEYYYTFE